MITNELKQRIESIIEESPVMLFLKGTPSMPQCGFSATVVGILKEVGVPFGSFDILGDPELREGLKEYARWPTYPQLYIGGKLVGGCDIVRDMHARGELALMLRGSNATKTE